MAAGRAWAIAAAVMALAMLLAGCGVSGEPGTRPGQGSETESVSGRVVDVTGASLTALDSFAIEDQAGTRWEFDGRGQEFPGFSPSHLRQHMVIGEPVRVSFRRENGALVVVGIEDAEEG